MSLLSAKYKTWEGAAKRAAFERSMNPGEFKRGDVASLYSFSIVKEGAVYRVAKTKVAS